MKNADKPSAEQSRPAGGPVVRVGPAGWSYPDWKGYVYPERKAKGFHEAEYLAQFFDTIEINTSFYGPIRPEHARLWLEKVAANARFMFTAKLLQRFTHDLTATTTDEKEVRVGFDEPTARVRGDRNHAIGPIERGTLHPGQRLPRLDPAEHHRQRRAARGEGERGRREMQMHGDDRGVRPRGARASHGGRDVPRRPAVGAAKIGVLPRRRRRRLVQREHHHVVERGGDETREARDAVEPGEIRRQDDHARARGHQCTLA